MAISARQHEVRRIYAKYLAHQITWAEAERLLTEFDAKATNEVSN